MPARFAPAMPAEEFDAVLSLRTLHENFDQSGVPRWESLLEAINEIKEGTQHG